MVLGLGYQCLHRSEDAANYRRGDEGLDFIYAHRPIARRLLAEAESRDTEMGHLRVVNVEGLVGLKLQGVPPVFIATGAGAAYEPERTTDSIADWTGLMEVVEVLCPRWPEREPSMGTRLEL
jgi:hypothetical protein